MGASHTVKGLSVGDKIQVRFIDDQCYEVRKHLFEFRVPYSGEVAALECDQICVRVLCNSFVWLTIVDFGLERHTWIREGGTFYESPSAK